MAETREQAEERKLRELEGKNVAQYSVLLDAWIQTKMERDRTLVTLSSVAIGLLVTILTTVGPRSWFEIIPYVGAFGGFGYCVWCSLTIYQLNAQHIENELRAQGNSRLSKLELEKFDKRSLCSFRWGVVFFCLIGLVAATVRITEQRATDMNEQKIPASQAGSETQQKSLSGLENLRPEAVGNQGQQTTRPQEGDSSGPSQSNGSSDKKKQ